MSDWKSRATPVAASTNDWKSRASTDPAQPSVAAIGSPDGPAPQKDLIDKAWDYDAKAGKWLQENAPIVKSASDAAEKVIGGAGKAIDYVGGYARTGAAAALGSVLPTVHNPVEYDDLVNMVKGQAPGVGDYMAKSGMEKEMDTGVTIPGMENHRLTLKGLMNVIGNYKTNPIANGGLQKLGRGMYRASLGPIETAGEKFNKWDVADEYNKQGIKNPLKLNESVQNAVDANEGKALDFERRTAATPGAQVDAGAATAPAQSFIEGLKKLAGLTGEGSPESNAIEEMQKEINHRRSLGAQAPEQILRKLPYTEQETSLKFKPNAELPVYDAPTMGEIDRVGTPDPVVPNKFSLEGQNQKGISGTRPVINNPVDQVRSLPVAGEHEMVTKVIPKEATVLDMTEGKPGLSPVEQGNLNARDYKYAGSYDTFKRGDMYQRFYKALARGGKVANESAVGEALGPEAQAEYAATNEGTGKLLATRNAARNVQAQAERLRNSVTTPVPNGTEGAAGAMSAAIRGGGPEELSRRFLESMIIQKLAKGAQLGAMPTGYVLRNIPTSVTRAAPLLSTWDQIKGDDNGQK